MTFVVCSLLCSCSQVAYMQTIWTHGADCYQGSSLVWAHSVNFASMIKPSQSMLEYEQQTLKADNM